MTRLEARALTGSRGPATLFRDVSFQVSAGEWVALRGPNGSGKTTLLRCVAGLMRADAGEIFWDGESTRARGASFRADLLYGGHQIGRAHV